MCMTELDGIPADVDHIKVLALNNYGHFTSMRAADQRVRGLSLHLTRLVRDCRAIFDAELDPDWVRHLVRHALAGTGGPVVVRVTVFDPALELGRPGTNAQPHVLVTTRLAAALPLPTLRVQTSLYCRELPTVKHVGLFGLLCARRVAQRNGFDDVLFTDAESTISEGATWNIGFVDGDRLVWPKADCLPGVTMNLINQVHDGPRGTMSVSLGRLHEMQAVFATSAAIGVRPIMAIDNIQWATDQPILGILQKEYAGIPPEQL